MSQPATPVPALADTKPRRRISGPMWPLIVLALILLYNLFFTHDFFKLQIRYTRVDVQMQAETPVRKLARNMTPFKTFQPGDIATLTKSDVNIDRSTWIEVAFPGAEGESHGYLPADTKLTTLPHGPHLFGSLIDIFKDGARVMLLALGMTLVIATGGIDLSVGAVMAISGAIVASLLNPTQTIFDNWLHVPGSNPAQFSTPPLLLIISLPLLAGLASGAWNGLLIAAFDIQPIIATLVFMISGRGIALLITGEYKPTYGPHPNVDFIGQGFLLGIPFPLFIVLALTLLTLLLTRGTALGLFIESIGNNPAAARVAGINANFVKFLTYAFIGLCAAVAGLIQTTDVREAAPLNEGLYMELDAIIAVAIGGTSLVGGRFSIVGSLLGAITMQALRTTIYSTPWLPSEFTLIVEAIVLLLICLLQSDDFRKMAVQIVPQLRAAIQQWRTHKAKPKPPATPAHP